MNKILIVALLSIAGSAFSQQVTVSREALGSGQPELTGVERATKWDNNIYFAPQYMPGHPTAGTIYPRVIDVQCVKSADALNCKGYTWLPELGRGEYLMFRPIVVEPPKVITQIVPGPTIYVEVPVKKKKE
jgi:hypothetical protein